MARTRLLKPGFFANEDLAELPFEARLLFAGLWLLADREGRVEDRPKRIKSSVFPYDGVDVDAGLTKLHEAGFIKRYEAEGVKAIWIVSFKRHQNPHKREPDSDLPPCPAVAPLDAPRKDAAAPSNYAARPVISGTRRAVCDTDTVSDTERAQPSAATPPVQGGNVVNPEEPPAIKPPRKIPDTPHHQLVSHFCAGWERRYGAKYAFNGRKDGQAFEWMLGQFAGDAEKAKLAVNRYLADDDPFIVNDRHGIGILRSQFRKWMTAKPPPVRPATLFVGKSHS